MCILYSCTGWEEEGLLLTLPTPQNYSHFPTSMLREFGEVSVDNLQLLWPMPAPTPPSTSRGVTLPDWSGPVLQPWRQRPQLLWISQPGQRGPG